MTNEEKAKEITVNDVCCVWNNGCPNVYNAAMKMAEWKEQQMIDKTCEWLKNNTISVTNDTCTYTASSYDISKEEFIKEFKKAMEE